jgi:hypothetical protein
VARIGDSALLVLVLAGQLPGLSADETLVASSVRFVAAQPAVAWPLGVAGCEWDRAAASYLRVVVA